MSLFKAKDLWAVHCGQGEVFEDSSILVADLLGDGNDMIFVGSHNGVFRVFCPFSEPEAANEKGFAPTDLLIEVDLGQPILQIMSGRFTSGLKCKTLAILHPRSVAVYNFVIVSGSTEHGDQCQVIMIYEHQLKRAAYKMITGGFGGVEGRDFICVQGLDGTLMFYEQETLALTRPLPNFLLPSPFIYVPHTDSFVVLNANWFLECYRYQILGEDSSTNAVPFWTYNLGEPIDDMHYSGLTTTEAAIFIVTDRNLYIFSETGLMKFCKRLQYSPLCSAVYSKGEPCVMSIIVTDTNSVMIYEQTTLKWSAQLPVKPVAIRRGNYKGIKGCITILAEDGELLCCYLGTEPTLFVPPPLQESLTPINELEAKLAMLQHQIATYSQSAKNALGAPAHRPDLKLQPKVWPMLQNDSSCKLEVNIQALTPVHNLHVSLSLQHPLVAVPKTHYVHTLDDNIDVYSIISVMPSHTVPWDLDVGIVAVYLCSDESCGCGQSSITLPPQLVLELAEPVKESESTLVLSASQAVILPTIFPEFGAENWNESGSSEHNAGFRYKHATDIGFTITVNKNQHKYRIETNTISSLVIPVTVLMKKLASKNLRSTQHTLALNELLEAVDNNVELRNQIRNLQVEMKSGTAQMRAAQRRLLSKMRDKTPTDLSALAELITYTHDYILDVAHKIETAQNDLIENGTRLGSLIKLTISLIKLSGSALNEDIKHLSEALSNTRHIGENQGWAEIAEAALNYLLRTNLARSMRDQYMPPVEEDHLVTDSTTLKKYIAVSIDRVVKGQRRDDRAVSPIMESDEDNIFRGSLHSPRPTLYEDFDAEVHKLLKQSSLND